MHRTLENIAPKDFKISPIWYFLNDDQFTLESLTSSDRIDDKELIVGAKFVDKGNRTFSGYIYWGESFEVEYSKPVVFLNENGTDQIAFWAGIRDPKSEEIKLLLNAISLPISFKTEKFPGLDIKNGILDGIYFLNKKRQVICKNTV
jgi:hypothetical protein